jgi:hypothetical protein
VGVGVVTGPAGERAANAKGGEVREVSPDELAQGTGASAPPSGRPAEGPGPRRADAGADTKRPRRPRQKSASGRRAAEELMRRYGGGGDADGGAEAPGADADADALIVEVTFASWRVFRLTYVVNLRRGSARFHAKNKLPVGQPVVVRLRLPDGRAVDLQASVASSTPVGDSGKAEVTAEFGEGYARELEELAEFAERTERRG